jgi:precorrin-6A synthase
MLSPVRTLLLIGVGAGDPDFVTTQAIAALNRVDVFFVLDKPYSEAAASDLNAVRDEICTRYVRDPGYRTVTVVDPPRDRAAADYAAGVSDWRDRRAETLEDAIRAELPDGGCGGLLVWGDPCLYDSTIGVVEHIRDRGDLELDYEVIPGISSIQALAARHRLTLNRVGRGVQITSGRHLAGGLAPDVDDVVVMLDPHLACATLPDRDLDDFDIYWGAYLGTPDELLAAGPLRTVVADIARTRQDARDRKGWIMDSYLLRRRRPAG